MTIQPRRASEGGFTLVEVIIAIIVLTVGLLGLMSTAALVTRMIARGQRAAVVAAFTSQIIDEQRLRACNVPPTRNAGSRQLNRGGTAIALVVWWWAQQPPAVPLGPPSNTWQLNLVTQRLTTAGRWRYDVTETAISCIR
jgi:prepilin-type N-terminal cleavage/methylation domain-containing protein